LGVLMLLGVVCVIDSAILGSLLTPIKADWGLSDEQLGRLASSFTVAGLVGAPLFALLANRIGRKATLLAGVVIWSPASVASGFAGGVAALLFWRVLTGFGEAAYNGRVPSWLADLYRPRWRNLVFSLYMLRNKIGAALALVIGSWVAERYDWQVALWVSGIPGLLLALGLLPLREPSPGQSEGMVASLQRPRLRASLQVFRHAGFLLHLAWLSLFWIAMNGQFWIPAYLHRVYGLTNPQAAGFMAQVCCTRCRRGWLAAISPASICAGAPAASPCSWRRPR
jgi:MFS family permease